jgi:hypothetical protein
LTLLSTGCANKALQTLQRNPLAQLPAAASASPSAAITGSLWRYHTPSSSHNPSDQLRNRLCRPQPQIRLPRRLRQQPLPPARRRRLKARRRHAPKPPNSRRQRRRHDRRRRARVRDVHRRRKRRPAPHRQRRRCEGARHPLRPQQAGGQLGQPGRARRN